MSKTKALADSIAELASISQVEPSHLYRIAAKAFGSIGGSDLEKTSIFVIGTVFEAIASASERDDSGQGLIGHLADLISISVRLLSHTEWEGGRVELITLIELNRRSAALH